ncbi:polysaccharide pyruvyl transferase family protein [Ruficoccus sp. ZRK36]|uniref:polysaccharide pyruvyl transferase family protein n=1 Tax=Ruficoccus sp. ZRK36 TaxID=2866311 RepID=UPI001C73CAD0|nr:polysaccharide pyruvyl transferase family protein [Ruficoccus sp. ZRK36]QYY35958.1 polysaccharide pyruvyl transferase family protein [Ruficoccus sp. ZRK36]
MPTYRKLLAAATRPCVVTGLFIAATLSAQGSPTTGSAEAPAIQAATPAARTLASEASYYVAQSSVKAAPVSKKSTMAQAKADDQDAPTILLLSGWQTVNIGDIAHTPGTITLIKKHIPEAKIILWGGDLSNGVQEWLEAYFPDVEVVYGQIGLDGRPESEEVAQAFEDADIFMHGSGPGVHAQDKFDAWRRLTGKPYGYYGVTMDYSSSFAKFVGRDKMPALTRSVLHDADFVYFRETRSLQEAEEEQISSPIQAFAPDAVFGVDQYDNEWADAWMKENNLKDDEFICVIARTRFAPYYKIRANDPKPLDLKKEAYNNKYVDSDMAKLRTLITNWVNETGKKVVLCPEMTFEVELSKEEIYDKLPDDIRKNVVWVDFYWMPDQAAALYQHAIALVSMECHSPIIAAAAGVPSIYVTAPTETHKKQMWNDVGVGDWMFDIEETDGDELSETVLEIYNNTEETQTKMKNEMDIVHERQEASMAEVKRILNEQYAKRATE